MPPRFVRPDLGSFCRLDEIGLQVMGQWLEPGRAVLACRVIETDESVSPLMDGFTGMITAASAASPTTSPDRFWRPAGSDPGCTLDHEERLMAT